MMSARERTGAGWHPLLLIAGSVAALALLGSWLGQHWSAADEAVFDYFNTQLKQGSLIPLWAITNWRPFDTVAAAILLGFVLAWLRKGGASTLQWRMAQFIAFCVLLVAAKGIEYFALDIFHYERQSPSLVHADAVRLSEIVTWIAVKDRGSTVFPGDHAFVLFAAIGFLCIHAGRALGIVSALVLLPFAVPRLAAGAHWLSDVAVGGLFMAILLLCVGYATPLGNMLARTVLKLGARPIAICIAWGRRLRLLP
jgi:membrane-associated phospholipid phosphatase